MKLWQFCEKKVRIRHVSGNVYEGYGAIYSYADDNADGYASLDVLIGPGDLMAFPENEIAEIEVISTDIPAAQMTAAERLV